MCTEVEYRLDICRATNGSHAYKVDNSQKNGSFSLLLCERGNRFWGITIFLFLDIYRQDYFLRKKDSPTVNSLTPIPDIFVVSCCPTFILKAIGIQNKFNTLIYKTVIDLCFLLRTFSTKLCGSGRIATSPCSVTLAILQPGSVAQPITVATSVPHAAAIFSWIARPLLKHDCTLICMKITWYQCGWRGSV